MKSIPFSKIVKAYLLASALVAGVAAAPAMAQGTYTPGIDQGQQQISARIQQGMQSGHITPSEARALYARDRDISNREARYKSDGNVTPQERQELRADMSGLSGEVERLMANNAVVRQSGSTPGIDSTELQIGQRIDEGVRTGRISQREAGRLHTRERQIERREASYKSDGVVTQQERWQLRNDLSALRDRVERLMQDGRRG